MMKRLDFEMQKDFQWGDLLYWMLVAFILISPIISVDQHLGVYYDSIIADYAATQVLNPQAHQISYFAAFPYLTQVYHGSVGVLLTLLSIIVTGTTSSLQQRLMYSMLVLCILYVLDRILALHAVRLTLRRSSILVMAFLPTLMSSVLIQYYIELPGCILTLMALYVYDLAERKDHDDRWYVCAFALLGLAFYSYYNFLFFFPGMLLFYALSGATWMRRLGRALTACYGFLIGGCRTSQVFQLLH